MHVKKGDTVIVIAGKDRLDKLKGEVLEVDKKKNRVKVARANMMTKHQKPQPILGREGARVETENWIHASNVALYSEKLDRGVRTQKRFVGKDNQLFLNKKDALESFGDNPPRYIQKVRFCPKTEEVFDEFRN